MHHEDLRAIQLARTAVSTGAALAARLSPPATGSTRQAVTLLDTLLHHTATLLSAVITATGNTPHAFAPTGRYADVDTECPLVAALVLVDRIAPTAEGLAAVIDHIDHCHDHCHHLQDPARVDALRDIHDVMTRTAPDD